MSASPPHVVPHPSSASSPEWLARIVAIAADAIIAIDASQRIALFNLGAERMFGYTAAEVVGEPLTILLPPDARPLHEREVDQFGQSNETARRMGERRPVAGRRKNGAIFRAEVSISKLELGGQLMYAAVVRDATERYEEEERQRKLLEATQAAMQQRDEVLRTVSHDLRDPLSAINVCAAVLDTPDATEREDYHTLVSTIREAVRLMRRLMSDLVDMASIEAGRLDVTFRSVDPVLVVGRTLHLFDLAAAEQSITLQAQVPEHLPLVHADSDRLLQVLSNLVSNALKFTPTGGTVTLGATADDRAIHLSVADTGPGIPPQELPYVFDRFWYAARGAKARSTGLGLAIAKGLVEAHGGQIRAESVVGVGSTFTITLPIQLDAYDFDQESGMRGGQTSESGSGDITPDGGASHP